MMKVGDLVRVYDLAGAPTSIVGLIHDVWTRKHINNIHSVNYVKIISSAEVCHTDWILASTVRIISKIK
jgi:hypothetical protein